MIAKEKFFLRTVCGQVIRQLCQILASDFSDATAFREEI
jgi:hypothetical protein